MRDSLTLRVTVVVTPIASILLVIGITGWLLWPVWLDYRNPVRVFPELPIIGEEMTVEGTFSLADSSGATIPVVVNVVRQQETGPVSYQSGGAWAQLERAGQYRFRVELKAPFLPDHYEIQVRAQASQVGSRKTQIIARPPHIVLNAKSDSSTASKDEWAPYELPSAEAASDAVRGALQEKHLPKLIQAVRSAKLIHADDAVLAVLFQAIEGDPAMSRDLIIRGIAAIGPEAEAAVPVLLHAMQDADVNVRNSAIWALGSIGPAAAPAVPDLIEALDDKSTRGAAVHALGKIGPDAKAAVPEIADLLRAPQSDRNYIPHGVGEALVGIGSDAIPALVAMMKDPDASTRRRAVIVLEKFGPRAEPAVPDLANALEDTAVRDWAAVVLGRIGPPAKSAIPALTRELRDKDYAFRICVARALGDIGPEAYKAVPSLTRLLKDSNHQVRAAAAQAIKKIDMKAAAKAGVR